MFRKILIAEDIDSISLGLQSVLGQFEETEIVHTKYCDDALLKIKRALQDNEPFDFLLTDLSFLPDHRVATLSDGQQLAIAVRKIQPGIKILVYSIEDRIHKIKSLFEHADIDGFVWKGRESKTALLHAIEALLRNEKYLPQQFSHILNPASAMEISAYDIRLINFLAQGFSQAEMSEVFEGEGLSHSRSYIEKRINSLKVSFKAKNSTHLVSLSKDLGII